ncbi:MAG TPA: hypothetical protein VLE99_04075 [Candidatus Saccharimonadales bacterium]|nr:hypothetical protein [Candidatus Saccharimonadales bacterium]
MENNTNQPTEPQADGSDKPYAVTPPASDNPTTPSDNSIPSADSPAPAAPQVFTPTQPTAVASSSSSDMPISSMPTPQPVAGAMPMPQPMVTPTMGTQPKSSRRLLLSLVGAAVVVVLLGGGAFAAYTYTHRISLTDISNARQATNSIEDDMLDIGNAATDMENASTTDEFNSKVSLINTKMADAQKEYKVLKSSHVQRDKDVHAKFKIVDGKWTPFISYINDNVSDMKTLQPIMLKFEGDITTLTQTEPSTVAALKTYLSNFKSILDDASGKIASAQMKVSENGKVLTAFKTFLDTSSQAVSKAQSDLNSGKDSFTIEDDLFSVDDAESTFEESLTSVESQISDHEKQVDPSTQFNNFQSALDSLYSKASK